MAKTTSIKSSAVVSTNASASTVTANAPASSSNILTVVVLDAKSQPVAGASVSITPSDASATTNNLGEAQFKLGNATKYEVTASAGNSTVTVPYYVTANRATRLIVNPVYVKSVEAQQHHSTGFSSSFLATGGIVLVIVIALVVIWRLFRRRK
jgi:cobalamin biosynthesis Mg chelatase CobN